MPAPAPSRSTGSFSISLGMLNVPVSLYTGTEEVRVRRAQFTRDGHKVGNQTCVKNDDGTYGAPVERTDIVKKYDTGDGLVDLSDDELDALSTVVPGVADLVSVQRVAFLYDGTYVPNGQVWQVRASKLGSGRAAKPNPGGQKAFALLLAALKADRSFALLRFAKAGTLYHAALLHTGDLIGLYTDAEVREQLHLPEPDLIEEEIALARQLLATAKSSTPVVLHNDLAEKVAEYCAEKIKGEGTEKTIAPVEQKSSVDLMELLRASVAAASTKVSA